VVDVARAHKQDMTEAIAGVLPSGRGRSARARALALAVDGAIVQAQMLGDADAALSALSLLLKSVLSPAGTAG